MPWGQHLFLLIEECDRYAFMLPHAFNKRKRLVFLARFYIYFNSLYKVHRYLQCSRLLDSNCNWTQVSGYEELNDIPNSYLSCDCRIESKKDWAFNLFFFMSSSSILLPSSHPTHKSTFSVYMPHSLSGTVARFHIMKAAWELGS